MKSIVITTIFSPTAAVRKFAALKDWRLVVVGDRKTPPDWSCGTAYFLSAEVQEEQGFKLNRVLPWNHYCRKMVGYLEAIRLGAECIVDTDDDNLPKPSWNFPEAEGRFETTQESEGFINVYKAFTDLPIWPRGFPLERVAQSRARTVAPAGKQRRVKVGVWQGLADGDPDVDAIYRLTDNSPCYFRERDPLVLGRGTLCPFNSQNTLFFRELFPLLYLPAHVTFRFTDILRGLVAQPIMWEAGYHLGFTSATVVQERNAHDYLKDFESEIPCYLLAQKVVNIVSGAVRAGAGVWDNLFDAYLALLRHRIVKAEEIPVLTAWLEDIRALCPPVRLPPQIQIGAAGE
jgi:hypothetical protein